MQNNDHYEYNYDNLVPIWDYSEFKHLTRIKEERTKFARGYLVEDGEFYIEPWFYTQLTRLFERFPKQQQHILDIFFNISKRAPKVLFTRDINDPVFKDKDYLLIEISEVIHDAGLKFDDISRGSDYGD
ncbi:MAG: hypothetical protein RBS24_03745 [Bacilli bacterium]|nr:hypothetical protein [Bacilli bacterium]